MALCGWLVQADWSIKLHSRRRDVPGGCEFQRFGHTVRLMAPKFVIPYRFSGKRGKNDAADAAAICEAVIQPNMRFVHHFGSKPAPTTDFLPHRPLRPGCSARIRDSKAIVN